MQPQLLDIDTALLTKRTVVRRFRENEGEQLYQLIQNNHSRLSEYFPETVEIAKTKEACEIFIRQKIAHWLLQQEYMFGVWDNESAKLIGIVWLFDIKWQLPHSELRYFIDREFGEKGIMTEATFAVIQFAFQQLKMRKLYIRTAMDNYSSQRLARKCGFRREGDLRAAHLKPTGVMEDQMLMGLILEDFEGMI
ncbi:MAG: GNAT family N-acetyltransferase [Saprospiraceae bacterium]|nr:GNAT family N-acetyltransferase [Saprospiraceae bacterium]